MKRLPQLLFFLSLSSILLFAQNESSANAEFKRLLDLKASLEKIPIEKQDAEPYKSFIKKNENEIAYSDPAGEWYVRSELFWELRDKYKGLPIAEEIAWAGAQNPLPGECEGYINCWLYAITITNSRYLSLYPDGKYSKQAVEEIVEHLPDADSDYEGPYDAADRAELKKLIASIRKDLSGVTHSEKDRVFALLKILEEKHKL